MCLNIIEKKKLHKVERKKHMIAEVTHKNYGIFYDGLNELWYFCYIDKTNAPKEVYDGSKESVNRNEYYKKYYETDVIDWSILEKYDSI